MKETISYDFSPSWILVEERLISIWFLRLLETLSSLLWTLLYNRYVEMNESGSGERLHLHLDCKKNPNYLILLIISYVKNVLPCSSTSELEDDSVICAAFTS